jgi:hypothetical protein
MAPDKAGSINRTPTLIVGAQFIEPVPSNPPGFTCSVALYGRNFYGHKALHYRATPKTIPSF